MVEECLCPVLMIVCRSYQRAGDFVFPRGHHVRTRPQISRQHKCSSHVYSYRCCSFPFSVTVVFCGLLMAGAMLAFCPLLASSNGHWASAGHGYRWDLQDAVVEHSPHFKGHAASSCLLPTRGRKYTGLLLSPTSPFLCLKDEDKLLGIIIRWSFP